MEERIIENAKDIESIKTEIATLKHRLASQGAQIDSLNSDYKDFKTSIELIKQATAYTETMLFEIKADIKEIRKEREQDHYIKPLETNAKVVWQITAVVIALIVGFLIKSLFPSVGI